MNRAYHANSSPISARDYIRQRGRKMIKMEMKIPEDFGYGKTRNSRPGEQS